MKTNKYNEELLYSLPDYVTGSLNDEALKKKIEKEISSNADFRNEYELMRVTCSTVKEMKLAEPPVHYFTNLVPNIQSRIEKSRKPLYTGIFRLANLFKYALPALSVIVLIFIFTFTSKNKNENIFVHTDDTINRIMNTLKDTLNTAVKTDDAVQTQENEYTENTTENKAPKVVRVKLNKEEMKAEGEKINTNNINIDALISETEETYQYDDYVYESDFSKLWGKSRQN